MPGWSPALTQRLLINVDYVNVTLSAVMSRYSVTKALTLCGEATAFIHRALDPQRPLNAETERAHRNGERLLIDNQRRYGSNAPSSDTWILVHDDPRATLARRDTWRASTGPINARDSARPHALSVEWGCASPPRACRLMEHREGGGLKWSSPVDLWVPHGERYHMS